MSEQGCMAIEGNFAWFSQRCLKPAVTTVWCDGDEFPVCSEHAPTT